MKKLLITVLSIVMTAVMIFGLVACGTSSSTAEKEADSETSTSSANVDVKIGFINHSLGDSFQQYMLLGGKETAEYLGYQFVSGSSEDDPIKELDLIKNFDSQGVKLLVLGAISPASCEASVDLAHELGMSVVTMDAIAEGSKADCQVGGDDVAAGYLCAKHLAEELDGKGKVAIAKMPFPMPPSDDRVEGFYKAFSEYPGIEVVVDEGAPLDVDEVMSWTKAVIQGHPDLDAFITICDYHALPIVKTIENEGKQDSIIATTVVESENSYLELKKEEPILKCVVAMHSYNYGALSVLMLNNINHDRPVPSVIKTTGVVVTSENVDKYMDIIKKQHIN